MSPKRLWIREMPDHITLDDFVWRRPADGSSSLRSSVDPDLRQLGRVPDFNRDAVWLAATAFLADRTVPRRTGWQRDLQIVVPVTDTDVWCGLRDQVESMLSFLTSDVWEVSPVSGPKDRTEDHAPPSQAEESKVGLVCLFSGGADSMCGAIRALAAGQRVTLVSHWDWAGHAAVQTRLVAQLEKLFGVRVPHVQVNLGRSSQQIGGGAFPDEPSRRSRSLLFITLGLAVGAAHGSPGVWVAENGFASLNPPLAPERLGALSTRTTHPAFLSGLKTILTRVGAYADFSNPFCAATKGEIFASVAETIGRDTAATLLSMTHSCSHVRWAGEFGRPPETHCGVCFGCIVRRGAFVASGLEDRTVYLATDLPRPELRRFLRPSVRADIEAVRYATSRGFGPADVLALGLPDNYDLEGALALVQRGFAELAAVELP